MNRSRVFEHRHSLGEFSLRPLDARQDALLAHSWVSQPYARYWLMNGYSVEQVRDFYLDFSADGSKQAYLGYHGHTPCFLIELYDPRDDAVGAHYTYEPGDIGMHVLVAPAETPLVGFTRAVFDTVIRFIFTQPQHQRIVVEPDVRNHRIHQINKDFGFCHVRKLDLGQKQAYLGFCTRDSYAASDYVCNRPGAAAQVSDMLSTPDHAAHALQADVWARVSRLMLRKFIAELAHERILKPVAVGEDERGTHYRLDSDRAGISYHFTSVLLPLEHWHIDPESIRKQAEGEEQSLDPMAFVLEFTETLGMSKAQLPVYLEEIASTLSSHAFKFTTDWVPAAQLATADFQTIEAAMIEGHPCFIANSGRIGFDAADYRQYAPEAASGMRLVWIAGHRSRTVFAACDGLTQEALLEHQIDATTRDRFLDVLAKRGAHPEDYVLMPVHPWQWFNKLVHAYAADIAQGLIICLGQSDDTYRPQQSIRTLLNLSRPQQPYVKMALSILNMGFMRGLSAAYMKVTPAINGWVHDTLSADAFLQEKGFRILKEFASVGYSNPHYDNPQVGDTQYRKMLAALWRESPLPLIEPQQRVMTMAALLHVDPAGNALLPALISASQLSTSQWLASYLDAYLTPLLHCFFKYRMVFMPHGENVILVLENHVPVRIFMKDIGEEVCLLNSDMTLPDEVARISVKVPHDHEELSIFTDMFDCFFRHLSAILLAQCNCPPEQFWTLVGECIHRYQATHPEFADRYQAHDLFAPRFGLSCLNRLQLANNQMLIDLTDPSRLLQFAGELDNPVAALK